MACNRCGVKRNRLRIDLLFVLFVRRNLDNAAGEVAYRKSLDRNVAKGSVARAPDNGKRGVVPVGSCDGNSICEFRRVDRYAALYLNRAAAKGNRTSVERLVEGNRTALGEIDFDRFAQ